MFLSFTIMNLKLTSVYLFIYISNNENAKGNVLDRNNK